MANKPFISVDGITVGEASALVNVIASNGDITTSNITVSNNANLGNVGNVIITGGTNGYVLSTNGSGALSWVAQSGGSSTISNGNSNVNIPSANGNINFSAEGNANVVVITGTGMNVTGTLDATGNFHTSASANIDGLLTVSSSNGNDANKGIAFPIPGGALADANASIRYYHYGSYYQTVFEIGVGNNQIGASGQDSINLVASGGVGVKTQTPSVEFEVTGRAKVSGNTEIGGLLTGTGNVAFSGANVTLGAVANLHISGGSSGQYLSTDGSGTLTWASVSGSSTLANGNSNVNIATANGNITMSAVGNANIVVVTGTGANINGYANVSGNVIAGNFIAGSGSGGNLSGANVISANTFTATGNITAGNANLGNATTANYFIGNFYGTANTATTAGTVTTNAQPNITSVGSLTGLTVSNATGVVNFTTTANVTLGAVANLHISGGTSGYVLQTDGSGTLSWVAQSGGGSISNISNGNSNVNIPAANGNVNISAVGNANVVIVTGTGVNVAGTGNFTGNITAGNFIAGSGTGGNLSGANNISANTFTGTLTTAAQPNITSVGTLTSLAVTGNISSGNANLGNATTSNYFIGSGANLTNIPAGNISGQVANALVAGTVYTNAQPNITSVGTLTSANVTGNIVSNANIVTDLIVGRTSGITITATGTNQNINLTPTGTGTVNVGNFIISNVQTPVADFDAATKKYVDDVAQGLNIHDSVQAATPTTLATITGGTITYNNGSSGVGANLTTTGTFNLIDGVNVQTSGTRILVKNEANAVFNGIYTWSNATVITRATDYNSVPEVEAGDFVFCTGGTLYDNTGWVQTSTVTAIGTAGNNIEFTQFSGAGTYTAGTGLTLTGSQFNISNTTVTAGSYGNGDSVATFTVNSQGQLTAAANTVIAANAANLTGTTLATGIVTSSLTSVGNLIGLTVSNSSSTVNFSNTANVTLGAVSNLHISGGTNAYVLSTDGSGNLSWVAQAGSGGISNISNGNSNVSIATANGNITFSAVGNANVMTITGTGANINGTANITGNVALSGANVSLGTVSNLHITGGSNGYVLQTDGTGNLSWAAQTGSNIVIDSFTGNGVQTVFTLTNPPISEDYTLINIDGVSQLHSAYTVANANVTLSSAPASGAVIEVMTFNLGGGGGGGGGSSGYTYVEATGNTTASVNTKYIVNTNTANLTITLPSTPSFGDEVGIIDGTGNASVHAITVGRNGGNIQGAASDMTVTTDRSAFTLVYYNASQGWVLTNV